MKKLALVATGVLSVAYLGAFELPNFGLDAEAKYSSEYVTRGRREGKHVFVPKAEVGIPVLEKGKVYVGTWAALGVDGSLGKCRNQVAPYIGATYDVTDMFTVDLGYIHHLYTNMRKEPIPLTNGSSISFKRNTSEVYAGVMADVLLSPSVYGYFDFDAKEFDVEGKVSYSFDFARFGVDGLALDLGAKLGYDTASKPFARSKKVKTTKDYIYCGANADLVYSFNENARARAGIACEGNAGGKGAWQNQFNFAGKSHHKTFVWFNASVDCSF